MRIVVWEGKALDCGGSQKRVGPNPFNPTLPIHPLHPSEVLVPQPKEVPKPQFSRPSQSAASPADHPTVLPLHDILTGNTSPVSWLLPNLLPQGSLVILAGMPGSGKSYLSYTLGLALATGIPFLTGTPDRPASVLYFDQENSRNDADEYLRWAWRGLGCPNIRLATENFHLAHFALGTSTWGDIATRYIAAYKPQLVVLDTTTPACHVQNENDNGEANTVVNKLRYLQTLISPAPAIWCLKHARDDPEKGDSVRGAKHWEGAVDSVIYHQFLAGRPRKDQLRKTKLVPSKIRAYGLRETVYIEPRWLSDSHDGIALTRLPETEK